MSDNPSINESTSKFPILTRDEINKLPSPEWLVNEILPMGQLAVIFGEPGSCKSFLALDIALSVAGNVPWQGRGTMTGSVVYIYAEGLYGAKKRLLAWEKFHGRGPVRNIYFIPVPPDLLNLKDVQVLINVITNKLPSLRVLIIVDTLARATPLADENSSKDMGAVINNCDEMRRQFKASLILVHHSGKSGNSKKTERGSSSIRGAMDTSIRVEKNKNNISVTCVKQKDALEFDEITLKLIEVEIDGESSCVLVDNSGTATCKSDTRITANEQKILNYLSNNIPSKHKWGEIKSNSGVPPGSFDRTLKNLLQRDLILKDLNDEYEITAKAITIIQTSINHHDSSDHKPSLLSHPFRGDRDDGDSMTECREYF